MSKNIIRGAFVAAFAFVAGYCVYTSQQETGMIVDFMANVEGVGKWRKHIKTGPGKTYDCPGLGTGDGKMCMSRIAIHAHKYLANY